MVKSFLNSALRGIKNPYVILVIADIVLSNLHYFFVGQYSDAWIYICSNGDVEWFYLDVARFIKYCFFPLAAVIPYFSKCKLTLRAALYLIAYLVSDMKNISDYFTNGNHGTIRGDLFVLFGLLFAAEIGLRIYKRATK